MMIEKSNSSPTQPLLDAPPEGPIQTKEWLLVAAAAAGVALFVGPAWTVMGLICIGPAILLKKYSHHFSEENQRRINRIYVAVTEIFSLIKKGIHIFSGHHKPLENVQKVGQPILLVHGYLDTDACWSDFEEALSERNLGPVYTINLGHPFLSISAYAAEVELQAKEIREKTGRNDLVLIGHSMGGLVSALYATKLAPKGTVTDVFTLGSPLNGAPLATIGGIGPNGREMRHGSPLLAEIRKRIESKAETIRFYHVGSEVDTLVPADSALAGCGKKFRVTDLSHTDLATSKKVSDWVCDQLQMRNFK